MKRRQFLAGTVTIPALGAAVVAGASVSRDTTIKRQIEHHIEALWELIGETTPEGVDLGYITVNTYGWNAGATGNNEILNPATLVWR